MWKTFTMTNLLSPIDMLAIVFFLACWTGFAWLVDKSPWSKFSLSHQVGCYRRRWMGVMAKRELRIVDTSIITGLQQGTAFFASTSILAIGGCFALLGSTDLVLQVFRELPVDVEATRPVWQMKIIGLMTIYAFAFFKFGWAYRLFNYCSILIGAVAIVSDGDSSIDEEVARAAQLNILAAVHFNAGLRGIFFSIGYLGWFLGPLPFIVSTVLVGIVIVRRQFFSASRKLHEDV